MMAALWFQRLLRRNRRLPRPRIARAFRSPLLSAGAAGVGGGATLLLFGPSGGVMGAAQAREEQKWSGSGPDYLGGEWANNMLQAALAEASKGNIDSTKEDMIRLTTTMQARIIQKFDDLEAEAYKNLPFWYRIWYRMRASKPLRTRVDVDDRREKGKMGFTAAIQGGRVIEKAGVGVTMLAKKLNARMAKQMAHNHPDLQKAIEKGEINNLNMWVNGISCIVHPVNPKAPTVHFNYRHFQITRDDGSVVAWWFGGGQDLTPIYLYDEDAKNVHVKLKKACDKHNPSYYPKFKKWADEYFYHKARREARGIGGIFFDDLDDNSKQDMFKFVKDCADSFEPSYFPILEMRSKESYSAKEKEWQALRHGRYVEFNLVYDRGTKFGFQVPGVNIEAVLMSLPLTVGFMYKHVPEIGSQEERLLKTLTGKPRDWVNL